MRINTRITKEVRIELFAAAIILLFVYAGAIKIIDHHNFQVELSKSPLLVDIAEPVSWLVPVSEILVAIGLLFRRTRLAAFYVAFGLMSTFTIYILSILTYSEYIPCGCGGVLAKLGWKEHFVFNLFFVAAAVGGIYSLARSRGRNILIASVATFATIMVVGLYLITYDEPNKYSSFDKDLLVAQPVRGGSIDLKFNSFYFAGVSDGKLYLSNQVAPTVLLRVDPRTLTAEQLEIHNRHPLTNFSRTRVTGGHFFIGDGTIPSILTGNFSDMHAKPLECTYGYFDQFIPLSDKRVVFRQGNRSGAYVLAISSPGQGLVIKDNILVKQVDGKFCVDGMMGYNESTHQVVYAYFYRNKFITIDSALKFPMVRTTLDSVSRARIKVSEFEYEGRKTGVVVPELIVNSQMFTSDDFLFLRSNIRARNESRELFDAQPRIDVFDLPTGHYLASFNLPLGTDEKPREFVALDNTLFALTDERLITFAIGSIMQECKAIVYKKFYRPVK